MSRESSSGGGLGICGVLLIVFITLKLTGNITWSWVWVLAPLWIPFGIVIVLLLLGGSLLGFSGDRIGKKQKMDDAMRAERDRWNP